MPECDKKHGFSVYQIAIQGNLDKSWSNWLNWLEVAYSEDTDQTTLTGPITDQAELRGILNKLWDLNKYIIAVNQLQDKI